MAKALSPAEWGDLYQDLRPTYRAFVERLEGLLETLLSDEEIPYSLLYSWSESRSAFIERLFRERRLGRVIEDPLALGDLAGVSIVAHAAADVDRIWNLVEGELEVDADASISIAEARAANADSRYADQDRLGYAFPYLIVSLPPARSDLSEWRAFDGLRVKVELQTALQASWEQFDDDELPYRRDASYPVEVQERLKSALQRLVAADDELASIWPEIARADELYEARVAEGDLELPINGRSLLAYLRSAENVADLVAVSDRAGLLPDDSDPDSWQIDQILIWLLEKLRLTTIAELDEFVRKAFPRAEEVFSDLARISAEVGDPPYGDRASAVILLLLVMMRADADTVRLTDFRPGIDFAVNTLIGNPVKRPDRT